MSESGESVAGARLGSSTGIRSASGRTLRVVARERDEAREALRNLLSASSSYRTEACQSCTNAGEDLCARCSMPPPDVLLHARVLANELLVGVEHTQVLVSRAACREAAAIIARDDLSEAFEMASRGEHMEWPS